MSWSKTLGLVRVVSPVAALGAMLALSGCFTPMYGSLNGHLAGDLQAIAVDPIPDQLGHYLQDELITQLNGTGSTPTPKYRLAVITKERVQSALVDITTKRATSATVVIDADYVLTPSAGGPAVTSGTATMAATYDRSEQRFANIRAARDAEIRAAKSIAQEIAIRLSAALATGAKG